MSDGAISGNRPFWKSKVVPWVSGRGRLSQAIELEEQPPHALILLTILVLLAGLVSFLFWASFTHVGEVASASGDISPVGTVRKIQHLEGGIVAAINVHEGDVVDAGQPLIELDPGSAKPELEQLRARLGALSIQQDQLTAFRTGDSFLATDASRRFGEIGTAQGDLLVTKRAALLSQVAVLREQIQQRRSESQSLAAQREKVIEQINLVAEQVNTRIGLVEKGLSPRMSLLDLQRDQARVKTQLAEIDGQITRAESSIAEAVARLPELYARSRRETAEDTAKLEAEVAEVRESLARAEDRVKRLVIRSPVRGTIKGLQTETIGGVIPPGSTVMEVIPSDVPLIIEARVQPKDIGFVHVGQEANVKLTAYDYTRFGGVPGRVETISATTFADEKGVPFYRTRIRLGVDHVGDQPGHNMIIPGMTVVADIKTGDKTVLAYLLKPLVRVHTEAFRER